ncbi:TatD family hydrolase [bacterium]|nr:TatD family hydrolase [bacterium]MBU1917756.1 TatD family hydrolase [bacterium]
MLTDTHCHLSGLSEEEINTVLKNAQDNGVDRLIAIGSGYGFEDNIQTVSLTKKHDNVFCSLGIHPHEACTMTTESFRALKDLITTENKVVAVGETGLDYHYMHSPKDVQQMVFSHFIHLAKEAKKPLVVHDRKCADECVQLIKSEAKGAVTGVVHCFSGTKKLAQQYLDIGFMISFTGVITFKKAHELRAVVKMVPLDRLMIETDAPFLAPIPYRGKKNEPAYVKYVAECVAQVKGLSFDEIAKATTGNAERFFGL